MSQTSVATPSRPLPSGTPAVQPAQARQIVVGEKAEIPLATIPYASGALSVPLDLKQSGLLRKLRLIFSGTVTEVIGTGTAVWNSMGIFGMWGYPKLATSEDSPIASMSAYMHWIVNICRRRNYDPTSVFYPNNTTSPQLYAQPTLVNGANAFAAYLDVFPELDPASFVGLLNLQEYGQAKVQLSMANWGRETDGITLTGNATVTAAGNLAVQQLVYEVPLIDPQTQSLPPMNLIHRYRTKRVNIGFVGQDLEIPLDAGPTYTRFYVRQVINGVQDSLSLSTIQYVYGLGKVQVKRSLAQQLAFQRDYFERDLPTGVFVIAFDPSDVIRSLDVAAPTLVMNLVSTAVLGAGNNYWELVSEEIVQLAAG